MENAAIINELAHRYMHSLPRNQEEIINDYIREWKRLHYQKCDLVIEEISEPDFQIDLAEIEVTDKIRIEPFNRAKNKRETRKAYEEYLDELGE